MRHPEEKPQLHDVLNLVQSTLSEVEARMRGPLGQDLTKALTSAEAVIAEEVARTRPSRKGPERRGE